MRYFFDIDDGERVTRDRDGVVLKGRQAVRDAAITLLPNIARDILPSSHHRVFMVTVRNDKGRRVFMATLSLIASWLDNDPQMDE